MKYGLKENNIEKIKNVFNSFSQVDEVILYGSRAMGNFKPGSDIDLSLKGDNLNLSILNKISLKLDDLYLPYTFDLSIDKYINNSDLVDHIKRIGIIFYQKIK